jgi:hypothetical protein
MNRTLYAMALFAALGITEVAHAQVNSTSPPAKPSAAEPIKQIPDPTLPNNNGAGCGMGMPQGRGSAQTTSPSMGPPPNPAAPCR